MDVQGDGTGVQGDEDVEQRCAYVPLHVYSASRPPSSVPHNGRFSSVFCQSQCPLPGNVERVQGGGDVQGNGDVEYMCRGTGDGRV